MAKSRTSSARGRAKTKPEPKVVVKERKTRTEVEVVDAGPTADWETGVAILTGVLLLIAILIVDYNLGKSDAGLFF